MTTYYKIATSPFYSFISQLYDRQSDTIIFEAFDHDEIELTISKPANETDPAWGELYTELRGQMIRISDTTETDVPDSIPLFVAISEHQVAELDAQLKRKLAAHIASNDAKRQEPQEDKGLADRIWDQHRRAIENYEFSHPLSGSVRQIAWANDIRFKTCKQVIFEDPEFAMLRIENALISPEMRSSSYWIDNRYIQLI